MLADGKQVTWYRDSKLAQAPVTQLDPLDIARIFFYFLAHDGITTAVRRSADDVSLVVFLPSEMQKPLALPVRYMGYNVRVRPAHSFKEKMNHV